MQEFTITPGQRWVSDSEPELGLGMLLKTDGRTADIVFPAAEETRCYVMESAPLRRVIFKPGEFVTTHDGWEMEITSSTEKDGIVTYFSDDEEIPEARLSDSMSFCKPQDRLHGCQVDELRTYQLRVEALYRNYALRRSPVRGFVGARADLIPHQMSIVTELSKRVHPRALLADEVGLGKTIEACMIMHRLHMTGRADRVLIVLPEPLINQWFVELLRRFNLMFSIFDDERCRSLDNEEGDNPFLDSQLIIVNTEYLAHNEDRALQVREAGFDMMIVDEAHHLEWSTEAVSEEYALIEALAQEIPSVLLLSATPQQLGAEGHFARLRLLDPERFSNLKKFIKESSNYELIAGIVEHIQESKPLLKKELAWLNKQSSDLADQAEALTAECDPTAVINQLLDRFGAGRVMFRNTRNHLSGFPERKPHFITLEGNEGSAKIEWLAQFLSKNEEDKFLLICKSKKLAETLVELIQQRLTINVAAFHEDLSLNQRDRNAAYFSKSDGARLLICSEIGSEGRNFQFAHHLILFDLPEDPELLEQRIGRLDRIGQTETINIHVPVIKESYNHMLAQWYHKGIDAFRSNVHGVSEIYAACKKDLVELKQEPDAEKLDLLISKTKKLHKATSKRMANGYDKLLEMHSNRSEQAGKTISNIEKIDKDEAFEKFMIRLWDHFRLEVEELGSRSYFLTPGNVITDAFPNIPDEGLTVTFDREIALSREDIGFMSMDHPICRASYDILLGSENGNATFGIWAGHGDVSIIMESVLVLESIAPADLHVDRFLPATPIRVAIDHNGKDLSSDTSLLRAKLEKRGLRNLMEKPTVKQEILPKLTDGVQELAKKQVPSIIAKAIERVNARLDPEIARLQQLALVNNGVSDAEISKLIEQKEAITEAIEHARIRIDAVKLIWKE